MTWQEKVKQLMQEQNINQKQLSQRSGITEASVSRYLKSERTARIDIIVNFAKALNVTTEYLLNEDDETELEPYTEIATAIARNGGELTAEEKNTKDSYNANAVKFANTVDRKNNVSFVARNGTTYKYNKNNGTFAIITKRGIVITYFKPKDGYDYYKAQIERAKK